MFLSFDALLRRLDLHGKVLHGVFSDPKCENLCMVFWGKYAHHLSFFLKSQQWNPIEASILPPGHTAIPMVHPTTESIVHA
jgi:hypothetical protein